MNHAAITEKTAPALPHHPLWLKKILSAALALVLPLACHLGFSWIGFNPTDDGWLVSVARRLLDGEVPHRDFIWVRPALSAVFNIPWAAWGGPYTIWLSRLGGWLCLAAIAWIWSGVVTDSLRRSLGSSSATPVTRYALYATVLLLTAHTYPVMMWHSLDAMLLASIALTGIHSDHRWLVRLAFVAAGTTVLCRQNFVCFIPILLICAPSSIRSLDSLWYCLPPALYFLAMLALGAAEDFLAQISATRGLFWEAAIQPYLFSGRFWIGCFTGLLTATVITQPFRLSRTLVPWLPASTLMCVSISLGVLLWRSPDAYYQGAFILAGFALGSSLIALGRFFRRRELRNVIIIGLGLSWVQTISVGYASPALSSGILLATIWLTLHALSTDLPSPATARLTSATIIVLLVVGFAVVHARLEFPYRDRPAEKCSFAINDVFDGGAKIRTSVLTYAALKELQDVRTNISQNGLRYAILTDFSAAWIRSPERNPLPIEWAQGTELANHPALVARVTDAIAALPDDFRIIVQRFQTSELRRGFVPVPHSDYFAVQNWVQRHGQKIAETAFFEIYLPPRKAAPTL